MRSALLDNPDHFCKQMRLSYKTILWAKSLSFLHYKTIAVIILKSFIVEERCVITDSHCRPTAPLPSGTIKQTQKNKNRLLQEIQMQNTNTDTNTILKCLQDNQVDFQKNRSRPQREVTRIQKRFLKKKHSDCFLIDSIELRFKHCKVA